MGHFLSTRPFSNSDFARSILKTAIQTILIAWGLWFAGFAICLLIAALTQSLPAQIFPPEIGFWYLPLTLLGLWTAMTNATAVGLTGRGVKFIFIGTTVLFFWAVGMIVIKEFMSREILEQFSEISVQIVSIAIVAATPLMLIMAHRQNLLSRKSQCVAALLWIGIAAVAIAIAPRDLSITAATVITAFSALAVLPLATIPLAIAWNRHR